MQLDWHETGPREAILGECSKSKLDTAFPATHAVVVDGEMEDLHSHDWQVRVALAGSQLDSEHLLVDFHAVERSLEGLGEAIFGRDHERYPAIRQDASDR